MDLFGDDLPDRGVGDPSVPEPGRTPPPARAPGTSDRLAIGDWEPARPARGSRRWLLVAAVAPWVVVAAVLATGARGPEPVAPSAAVVSDPTAHPELEATPPAPAPTSTAHAPQFATPSETASETTPSRSLVTFTNGAGPSTRGHAIGVATTVARSWLSTRPPGPAIAGLEPGPGAEDRYVEHLVVESVDHPARGALVVTIRALVLPVEGDAYGPGQQVRLAVPVTLDADHARPAGPPWPLPVDDADLQVPTTAPVDDPDLMTAATDAVAAAGYRDVALTALERTSGWAWIARVRARAPGQGEPDAHAVWLRADVGRLVVAGTAPPAGADPPTATPAPGPPPSPTTTESEVAR